GGGAQAVARWRASTLVGRETGTSDDFYYSVPRRGEMKRRNKKSESGVVLITVLSGILVLTVVALALASAVRVSQDELGNRKEHLQAYYMARGAVFTTAALLSNVSPTPKEGFLLAGQSSVEWEESLGRVRVDITDESGKINLNQASEQVLERLLV